MDQTWRLELLGRMRLSRDGLSLTEFGSHKAAELLAFLALSAHRSLSREELGARLWPDHELVPGATSPPDVGPAGRRRGSSGSTKSDPEVRRKRIRNELLRLRGALEQIEAEELLRADRETISLASDLLVIDTAMFQALRKQAARAQDLAKRATLLDAALRSYTGPLACSLKSEVFLRERDYLAEQRLKTLLDLAQTQEALGEAPEAHATLLRAVSAAPHSEEAHTCLIRRLIAADQKEAARRQYQLLLKSLQGSDASESLRALVAPLYGGRAACAPLPASQPADLQSSDLSDPKSGEHPVTHSTPRLPYYSTAFFGRELEIAWLIQRLLPQDRSEDASEEDPAAGGSVRLVTLTGPGGSGKTRLAVEAARRLAPAFRNAVWLLPLVDLSASEWIGAALLRALNISPQQEDLLQQAALVLARRPSLLLLDNLEHLLPQASDTVERLMTLAPTLRLLVTSRHALHLPAGVETPLAPLPLPQEESRLATRGSGEGSSSESYRTRSSNLLDYAAVALFVDRARAIRSGFATHARSQEAIASICRELEGIPLALEIAAARAASYTPSQILDQVRQSPLALQSRNRDLDPRHRTVEGVIAGSYDRLTREQQRLFRHLAIFRGFSAEAAGAVCETAEVPSLLQGLIDRSLVTVEARDEIARFRLLEIPRAFGQTQWSDADRSWLADRHFEFFLHLAETAEPHLRGPEARFWLDRLETETDNLSAALERSRQAVQWERALRLAAALAPFWDARGHLIEGRRWLAELLPYAPPGTALRAHALHGAGVLANRQGDLLAALSSLQEAVGIRRRPGDEPALASSLHELGRVYHFLNRFEEAWGSHTESVMLWRRQPEPNLQGLGRALNGLAATTRQLASPHAHPGAGETLSPQSKTLLEEASRLLQESEALLEEAGDRQGVALSLTNQGLIKAIFQGRSAARSYYQRSLDLYERLGDRGSVGTMLHLIGTTYEDEDPQKIEILLESLRVLGELGERNMFLHIIDFISEIEYDHARYERSMRLRVAAAVLRRASGLPPHPYVIIPSLSVDHMLSSHVNPDRFESLWTEANLMSYEQLLAYALSNVV